MTSWRSIWRLDLAIISILAHSTFVTFNSSCLLVPFNLTVLHMSSQFLYLILVMLSHKFEIPQLRCSTKDLSAHCLQSSMSNMSCSVCSGTTCFVIKLYKLDSKGCISKRITVFQHCQKLLYILLLASKFSCCQVVMMCAWSSRHASHPLCLFG